MTESVAPTLADVTSVPSTTRASPWGPTSDAPLIRVTASGQPDPIIAAIARHIAKSGSVFLELPGGQLTLVLRVDGKT
jgi:hypothetical protein